MGGHVCIYLLVYCACMAHCTSVVIGLLLMHGTLHFHYKMVYCIHMAHDGLRRMRGTMHFWCEMVCCECVAHSTSVIRWFTAHAWHIATDQIGCQSMLAEHCPISSNMAGQKPLLGWSSSVRPYALYVVYIP
jgi:hypothetical protein